MNDIQHYCDTLKLPYIKESAEREASDSLRRKDTYADYLKRLLHQEVLNRFSRSIQVKIKKAQFTFLGYDFRSRRSLNSRTNEVFQNFMPAVSKSAAKSMRAHIRASRMRNRTELSLKEIADRYNPILRGWIGYYGCYYKSALDPVMLHFNKTLVAWAMRKYKKLKGHRTRASLFIKKIQKESPDLFIHWKQGYGIGFA